MKLKQRPLEVKIKFSDEHPLPFHMGVPPPWVSLCEGVKE